MTSYRTGLVAAMALLMSFSAACGDDGVPPTDSGMGDSAVGDSAMGDSTVPDSSPDDTGTMDSSPGDAGDAGDATMSDAGDAGDATMSDAGDAGDASDAASDAGLPVGARCTMSAECESGICIVSRCRAPSCSDGVFNGDESDLDCGGSCPGCLPGGACIVPGDCASAICTDSLCIAPSCTDGIINQDETDIDCGGAACMDRCAIMEMCATGSDCTTGVCMGGECQAPTCTDGVMNGRETDVDCGGPTADGCPRCPDFSRCDRGRDCIDGMCTMGYCGTNPCIPFGTDTFGYVGCSYSPTTLPCPDISATGTATGLGDDDDVSVAIGFSFDFYGTTYTMANVESNGAVSFDTAGISAGNSCLPSTSIFSPAEFIAVLWDDLDPGEAGSEVWYQTLGTAPNRQFVVQWDTERFFAGTDRGVFTVVLNETSNDIQACYVDTDFGDMSYDDGAGATAGIQGSTTNWNQFSCNMPSLTDGLLIQYLAP